MDTQNDGLDLVILSEDDHAVLLRDIRGHGGFQSLLRAVRRNMRGNVLLLTPSLRARIERYASKYGGGGFQQRLGRIVAAASDS